jgi:hypothetical protein
MKKKKTYLKFTGDNATYDWEKNPKTGHIYSLNKLVKMYTSEMKIEKGSFDLKSANPVKLN